MNHSFEQMYSTGIVLKLVDILCNELFALYFGFLQQAIYAKPFEHKFDVFVIGILVARVYNLGEPELSLRTT